MELIRIYEHKYIQTKHNGKTCEGRQQWNHLGNVKEELYATAWKLEVMNKKYQEFKRSSSFLNFQNMARENQHQIRSIDSIMQMGKCFLGDK